MTGSDQHRRLLIFDGNNVVMRCIYGMANARLTSAEGVPSGGVFGSLRAIESMISAYWPSHVLVTFDSGRSRYRTGRFPAYKASRSQTRDPDGFERTVGGTFAAVKEILGYAGVATYESPGVEADDHIAAAIHLDDEIPAVIVSSDHDLHQLVSGRVLVHDLAKPMSPQGSPPTMDVDRVIEKYGLPPERLPELWALQGDPSDGIPGVPGIGPRRALRLLREHGDLSHALSSEKVSGHERQVVLNQDLIELGKGKHSPLSSEVSLDDCRFDPDGGDRGELTRALSRWGFSGYLSKMERTGRMW